MDTFVIELNPKEMTAEDWEQFQADMDAVAVATNKYISNLAVELDVSEACATDIYYLRTRSYHTEELEERLIRLHREGRPPNVCAGEWPDE